MGGEDCGTCGLLTKTNGFIVQPFTSLASNTSWFLLIGLILIAAYLWREILKHIESMI